MMPPSFPHEEPCTIVEHRCPSNNKNLRQTASETAPLMENTYFQLAVISINFSNYMNFHIFIDKLIIEP
jgi:hypothetical protein